MVPVPVLHFAEEILAALAALRLATPRLQNDSRHVGRGDVFVAYPGARADGRVFIEEVFENGAAAVLAEAAGLEARAWPGPVIAVAGLTGLLGELSARLHGHPSAHLALVGITGTNGKTSTAQWIAGALGSAGRRCAMIGTLGNGFPGELDPAANTTPDALHLHALLARFIEAGATACAMEASSIGLDQGRCDGTHFEVAVFTNLTRDHLDYHGSMEAYAEAKRKLFRWPGLPAAVINLDDAFGAALFAECRAPRRIGYSLSPQGGEPLAGAEVLWAADIDETPRGIAFTLHCRKRRYVVEAAVVGRYNVANLLAVAGTLLALGIEPDALPTLLSAVTPPPGRMQRYGGAQAPLVAVDYAHTPDALENALSALRPAARQRGGRLVCVFGCGGDRDRGKRPLMGEAAVRLADRVWLTSDNPRSEEPQAILDDIVAGQGVAALARREVDRRVAIETAIVEADERDVILVAGKGHEDYQEIHGRKLPYSDALVVNAALAARRELQERQERQGGGTGIGMMSLNEAIEAVGGRLVDPAHGALRFESVSTDSRKGNAGALFVALAGERFDAHDFVGEVAMQGAVAAVVRADRVAALASTGLPAQFALLAVDDPRLALGRLAAAWRKRFAIPVIGVTGSNGKTTTKEMIASILRAQAAFDGVDPQTAVLATAGNLNNDIGLPMTVLQLGPTHRYAVIEMGMNHPGEIGYLAAIASPTAGVVTNALRAHLEGLGSTAGIAREKGALYESLRADAVAAIDARSEFAPLWKGLAGTRRILSFGLDGAAGESVESGESSPACDVRGSAIAQAFASRLTLTTPQGAETIVLPAAGRHNAHNATAAAAVCLAAGIELRAVVRGLAAFAGVKGRLQKKAGGRGATLVDDTYNANPDSVRAAIDVLAGQPEPRVLVLGDMGEVGSDGPAMHCEVVAYARERGIDTLFVLGDAMRAAVADVGHGIACGSPEAVAEKVWPLLDQGTTVLVKGSRFMKMERVVERLSPTEEPTKENGSCS
jgi:MurE/MurF fusion protein